MIINRAVLIDCGVPFKVVQPYLKDLKLVLLTHIHGDHFKPSTIRRISNERPMIRFGACEWLIKPLITGAGVPARQVDLLKDGFMYNYGTFTVSPVPLVHDVPNCGYKIHFPGGKMIYATDTANMNGIDAPNYDLYMVEANYGEEEIQRRINDKKANDQFVYEKRVLRTHLSREQCNDWVYQMAGPLSEIVYLHAHKEEENDRETSGSDD